MNWQEISEIKKQEGKKYLFINMLLATPTIYVGDYFKVGDSWRHRNYQYDGNDRHAIRKPTHFMQLIENPIMEEL